MIKMYRKIFKISKKLVLVKGQLILNFFFGVFNFFQKKRTKNLT